MQKQKTNKKPLLYIYNFYHATQDWIIISFHKEYWFPLRVESEKHTNRQNLITKIKKQREREKRLTKQRPNLFPISNSFTNQSSNLSPHRDENIVPHILSRMALLVEHNIDGLKILRC